MISVSEKTVGNFEDYNRGMCGLLGWIIPLESGETARFAVDIKVLFRGVNSE